MTRPPLRRDIKWPTAVWEGVKASETSGVPLLTPDSLKHLRRFTRAPYCATPNCTQPAEIGDYCHWCDDERWAKARLDRC